MGKEFPLIQRLNSVISHYDSTDQEILDLFRRQSAVDPGRDETREEWIQRLALRSTFPSLPPGFPARESEWKNLSLSIENRDKLAAQQLSPKEITRLRKILLHKVERAKKEKMKRQLKSETTNNNASTSAAGNSGQPPAAQGKSSSKDSEKDMDTQDSSAMQEDDDRTPQQSSLAAGSIDDSDMMDVSMPSSEHDNDPAPFSPDTTDTPARDSLLRASTATPTQLTDPVGSMSRHPSPELVPPSPKLPTQNAMDVCTDTDVQSSTLPPQKLSAPPGNQLASILTNSHPTSAIASPSPKHLETFRSLYELMQNPEKDELEERARQIEDTDRQISAKNRQITEMQAEFDMLGAELEGIPAAREKALLEAKAEWRPHLEVENQRKETLTKELDLLQSALAEIANEQAQVRRANETLEESTKRTSKENDKERADQEGLLEKQRLMILNEKAKHAKLDDTISVLEEQRRKLGLAAEEIRLMLSTA
ncbi:hypothetical protein CYLTODRAFT_493320 [Cylindrobasidium torrendii FP15055 ss-10]|uniref:Uncharacterized protein n=1 Tax=Cylindrobasidium torrendii FP15055 ss-10 TaxID=1314674 RepID=A0A0D7B3V5_9AGAR|nr:hypothetical protein CYLTODRAFT_493320 [Cylindrobasidium torrendii FP15055 ss-10]